MSGRSVNLTTLFLGRLRPHNASKQKEGHCDKTILQIFFHFHNSEYLCFIDIPCQNSAKNIQWLILLFLLFLVMAAILDS